jgi:uncharacterized membrane protein YgcG
MTGVWRPAVPEERWLALTARYMALEKAVARHGDRGDWKQVTVLTRTLLFVLGVVLASLLGSIVMLVGVPWPGLVAGIVPLAAAEHLIRHRRMFACGLDEALFLSGAAALTFEVTDQVFGADDAWPWIVAVAAFATGRRLLNRWLVAVAALVSTLGVFAALGAGWDARLALPVSAFAFVAALTTLAACRRTYLRPSHDAMFGAALVAFTVAACAWGMVAREVHHDPSTPPVAVLLAWAPVVLVATLGVACLVCGFRWRMHAPLWAGIACVATLLGDLLQDLGWAWEWRLIAAGAVTLAVAIAIERALRRSRDGLTSRRVVADDAVLDLLQLGGAAAMSPGSAPRPDTYAGGGGRFGGGGASGGF